MSQQMLMIGSELSRFLHLKDNASQQDCLERALELIDLTIHTIQPKLRTKEIILFRALLQKAKEGVSDDIEQCYRYCLQYYKLPSAQKR